MIGRFSETGVYRELAESQKFYPIAFAGGLALASYLWDRGQTEGKLIEVGSAYIGGVSV